VPVAKSWFLTISHEKQAESVVIKAAGRLGSAAAAELAAALSAAIADGSPVILDIADVDYLSSAGLDAIGAVAARMKSTARSLEVRGAQGATKLSLDLADG
jgi:anti-anti-sigma factor